jgi:hypothetical protein
MELETAQALASLGLLPSRRNDYASEFEMGSSLRDTQSDFVKRVKSGLGIGSVPGHRKGQGPRRILDNGELNLGRLVEAAPGPEDFIGEAVRILDLRSDSNLAQFVTVTFSILPVKQFAFDVTDYGGPIVGIVEFGNGSGVSQVEIDVRRGTLPYNTGFPNSLLWDAFGAPEKILVSPYAGVSISVPGSSVRVFARNDANYRPYPGNVSSTLNNTLTPMKVMAHVSYGVRPSQFGATRTVWLMKNGTTPAGNAILQSAIPPFARSLYIMRDSSALPFALNYKVSFADGSPFGAFLFTGTIAAGAESPVIPLPGVAEQILITFPPASQGLASSNLALVYNIGV